MLPFLNAGVLGGGGFRAPAVHLNGASDWYERTSALSGIANGKKFLLNFSIRPESVANNRYLFSFHTTPFPALTGLRFSFQSGGAATIDAYNGTGAILSTTFPASTFTINSWFKVALSVDLSDTGKRKCMVNGSPVVLTYSTYTNADIVWTTVDAPHLGTIADESSPTTSSYMGYLAEFFLDTTTYLDVTDSGVYSLLYDTNNKPKYLGDQGKNVTGSQPLIYLSNPVNSFHSNRGSGGDFTLVGAPTDATISPSD